jgi:hypothetical protein
MEEERQLQCAATKAAAAALQPRKRFAAPPAKSVTQPLLEANDAMVLSEGEALPARAEANPGPGAAGTEAQTPSWAESAGPEACTGAGAYLSGPEARTLLAKRLLADG